MGLRGKEDSDTYTVHIKPIVQIYPTPENITPIYNPI